MTAHKLTLGRTLTLCLILSAAASFLLGERTLPRADSGGAVGLTKMYFGNQNCAECHAEEKINDKRRTDFMRWPWPGMMKVRPM